MEEAAPSRRGGMESKILACFLGFLGSYPRMCEGARARLGEAKDEEEESVEEEDSGETEGEDTLENAPEVPQGSNPAPCEP
ncbi:hypothetical protein O181_081959 [Austropuccinia psidii MF-1]|uniref:Uncharacterized protein n=1 Tax=Austropuccinia psidii MF-1 TaxID=1389203 RepID=A0A9Q3IKK9_9BASI|nr:hypothetical protein [Austropuccinia psidii MF-1]